MCKKHQIFLQELEEGRVRQTNDKKIPPADNDDIDQQEILQEPHELAENYDRTALKQDVENDLTLLQKLARTKLASERDPKLKKLVEELAAIARQAERDDGDERQKKNNRKVLIFSYYKDTARWIYDFLIETLPIRFTPAAADVGERSTPPDSSSSRFRSKENAKVRYNR